MRRSPAIRWIPVAITGTADVFEAHIPFIRPARVIIEYGAPIYIKQPGAGSEKVRRGVHPGR